TRINVGLVLRQAPVEKASQVVVVDEIGLQLVLANEIYRSFGEPRGFSGTEQQHLPRLNVMTICGQISAAESHQSYQDNGDHDACHCRDPYLRRGTCTLLLCGW